ncbi:caspase domain-containing protein [Lactarius sanguifluus]|nr:caspase domain-containing protein [Lactarius sanguifluus]
MGSFLSSIYSRYFSFCFRRINQVINPNGRIRLPDVEEGKQQGTSNGPTTKRRALLVGISYAWSQSDAWWSLENPHADVDLFWSLLVSVYGYSPEDITVLKDGPNIPDLLQPTRANMRLVSGAASGDKFTFFYSGHSDQQKSRDGLDVEEDGQDEVIVTSDLERNRRQRKRFPVARSIRSPTLRQLNDILVKPLPAGCFLLSVFDTCHSGTYARFTASSLQWLSTSHGIQRVSVPCLLCETRSYAIMRLVSPLFMIRPFKFPRLLA